MASPEQPRVPDALPTVDSRPQRRSLKRSPSRTFYVFEAVEGGQSTAPTVLPPVLERPVEQDQPSFIERRGLLRAGRAARNREVFTEAHRAETASRYIRKPCCTHATA